MRFGTRAIACTAIVLATAFVLADPATAQNRAQPEQSSAVQCRELDVSQGKQASLTDTTGAASSEYCIDVGAPGVLTVVVRSAVETPLDLFIEIFDENGFPVSDGYADEDLGGRYDAEQLAVTLARPGRYRVTVGTYDPGGGFFLGTSFIEIEGLAAELELDDEPRGASSLELDKKNTASVDPRRDLGDWWFFENLTKTPFAVTVSTSAEAGDLVLELYRDDDFLAPYDVSDQDLGFSYGNESITVTLRAGGERVYFLVRLFGGEGTQVEYEIQATRARSGKRP